MEYCPNCYAKYEIAPLNCTCGYPFAGNEKEKYVFMSERVKREKTIKQGEETTHYARYIIFIIGGLNFLMAAYQIFNSENSFIYLPTLVYGFIMIGLGFYSFTEPFYALLYGFILLICMYVILYIIDSQTIFHGFLFKLIFLGGFISGLGKIRKAELLKNKPI